MQTIRLSLAALLCAFVALSQGVVNGDRQFLGKLDASTATLTAPLRFLSSEPATCDNTKHEIYYNTTTLKARICNALNTWSDFTGSLTIPPPGPSSLGGVNSKDCSSLGSTYMLQKVNTDGSLTCANTSSGGGASSQPQLTDWQTTATTTTWTMSTCTTSTPCVARSNEHLFSPFTGSPYTCTYNSANGTSGDVYEYIDNSGAWTFLYGNGTLTSGAVTCSAGVNAVFQASISEFPIQSCSLYHWQIAASAIGTTPLADGHGVACSVPSIAAGSNINFTRSGSQIVINSSASGSSSAGGNGVFQESNGSGGFSASSCSDAFGVITCSSRSMQLDNGSFAMKLGQGFGVTTCSTTAGLQQAGWNVVNVTGDCTLSIGGGAQADGAEMDLLICEDATGGHAITFPASFVGVGTPLTTANKCSYQVFRGSTGGGSLAGHTVNATWFAMTPMVSY